MKRGLITIMIVLCATFVLLTVFKISSNDDSNASLVDRNGKLKLRGTQLVNRKNKPIQLTGMSYFWHNWDPGFYNPSSVENLVKDWKVNVVRAAIGVEAAGGYRSNSQNAIDKACVVVDEAINQGVYVIIDWHSHKATEYKEDAISFFTEMAKKYGKYPNVIYEIYNEPSDTPWSKIKPYAEDVIAAIREIDPDNIIIVGTPNWSQDVDVAADEPIKGKNIMYALHFYAATHKQWLRDKADIAMSKGLALFVSEWGTCDASGNTKLDLIESDIWIKYMKDKKLSWCNWSVNTKNETASAFTPDANKTGPWPHSELTESGRYIKSKLLESALSFDK